MPSENGGRRRPNPIINHSRVRALVNEHGFDCSEDLLHHLEMKVRALVKQGIAGIQGLKVVTVKPEHIERGHNRPLLPPDSPVLRAQLAKRRERVARNGKEVSV